nr:uncharacterized protein LOC127340383 [Lolium perenne]
MAHRWHNRRDAAKLGAATTRPPRQGTRQIHGPPRNLCVEAPPGRQPPTCSPDAAAGEARTRTGAAARHPQLRREKMPAPGTSSTSTSTLHEHHLLPSEPAKARKRPARAKHRRAAISPHAAKHAGRRTQAARPPPRHRGRPQQPPMTAEQPWPPAAAPPPPKLVACARMRRNRLPGPPPRVRAGSGRANLGQPSSAPAAEGRKAPPPRLAPTPRAATRDGIPAAAHGRTSFARRSAPAAAEGREAEGAAEPGG